jgi:hypothetical protein
VVLTQHAAALQHVLIEFSCPLHLPQRPQVEGQPLGSIYPVIFIDAIHVKIRDGKVANRPLYTAVAVTVDGEQDILGLRAGDGREGQDLALSRHGDQEP